MMNKSKSLHRSGWKGCFCCDRRPATRTTRTREARAWKRDQSVT